MDLQYDCLSFLCFAQMLNVHWTSTQEAETYENNVFLNTPQSCSRDTYSLNTGIFNIIMKNIKESYSHILFYKILYNIEKVYDVLLSN